MPMKNLGVKRIHSQQSGTCYVHHKAAGDAEKSVAEACSLLVNYPLLLLCIEHSGFMHYH